MKKVALVLCGSGYRDGSEIRESVAALLALSRFGAKTECFAPDDFQWDVVNCLTGETDPAQKRNMLVESARIARGEVKELQKLKSDDFDALLIPGGFGAAKNLCDFAFKGSKGKVRSDLQKVIQEFFQQGKPIGAICIAPAILALALRNKNLTLTVGEAGETAEEIERCGHRHIPTQVSEAHSDLQHKVVSTGAYMFGNAKIHEIFDGIQDCVKEVLRLCS